MKKDSYSFIREKIYDNLSYFELNLIDKTSITQAMT